MKQVKLRPQTPDAECEMCTMCGRGVGMVYDQRINEAPFMCWVCEMRFPPEQWEKDDEGCFFDLANNGGIDVEEMPNGGRLKPWLIKETK